MAMQGLISRLVHRVGTNAPWLQHHLPATQGWAATAHVHHQAGQAAGRQLTPEDIRAAYGHCIQQVRQYDYDNYVWAAQLPKEHRPGIFVLRAFNIETALVADQVRSKEQVLMQLRYQWWRDGVAAAFKGQAPEHPVLIALQDVLQQQQARKAYDAAATSPTAKPGPSIKQYHMKRMIDTREQDVLDTQPPLSIEGLETYAEGSASQLLYLQLASVGAGSREADHAASHLGKAVGLTTLLRGTPYHASQRRSYLPVDLCVQHNVSQEDIYSGESSEGLKDVVLAVASVAKGHLDEARGLSSKLPKEANAVMLASLACEEYLHDLEAANFDVYDPRLQRRPGEGSHLKHVLRVKWQMFRGTF